MRAVARFVASVMMVSGALLIADAAITLLWQEPVSAFVAERQQVKLKDALFDPPERVLQRKPLEGDAIARIDIPNRSAMTTDLIIRPGVALVIRDDKGRLLLHRRRVGDGWAPISWKRISMPSR
jgi:hypothetical protein